MLSCDGHVPKQCFDFVLASDAGAQPIIHNPRFPSELNLDVQQRKASVQSGQVPDLDRWGSDILRYMAECHGSAFWIAYERQKLEEIAQLTGQ